jgi:hypothetical protein
LEAAERPGPAKGHTIMDVDVIDVRSAPETITTSTFWSSAVRRVILA